jgi:hypothetical protein
VNNPIARFLYFWYDFIVGDDWTAALGVVVALAGTAALTSAGITAWWLLPLAVVFVLGVTLQRATRTSA